ncbi:hypothetical protein ElyMa_003461200 [Elysia marginata]|uniref:Uncharacterized protein n=1 Tax=Elysia marginata TaxID=1093978 RepID=A0AAV4E995_9GAST|nr:hypothetical protein ElyMa_003461200 [Elysia marginata]
MNFDLSDDLLSRQEPGGGQRRLYMRSRLRGHRGNKGEDECEKRCVKAGGGGVKVGAVGEESCDGGDGQTVKMNRYFLFLQQTRRLLLCKRRGRWGGKYECESRPVQQQCSGL